LKLPNTDKAIIAQEKLCGYVLSTTHPVGKFKAAFFRNLGFSGDNWSELEAEIRSILDNEATVGEKTDYGQKFEVRGVLSGTNRQTANIVTAWIMLNGENIPRFITAYPGD
jgi:hypothetical protein